MGTDTGHRREWRPSWAVDVRQVLGAQRRGAGDPTHRVDDAGRVWRAMRTPLGPATLCVRARSADGVVVGTAWGPGAQWALHQLPDLLGAGDDPEGFEAHHHPSVAEGWRRNSHWRLGATGLLMEAMVPSILEQKVTGKEAFGAFRQLVRRYGEAAPGPTAELRLMVQPTPERIAAVPSWEWLRFGVQPTQSRTVVTVSRLAASVERLVARPLDEVDTALRSIRGIGVWTSAEVRARVFGDADAVSFGDYHLANHVGWALFGHDITDEEMAVALEPFRPQRGRAAAMAMAGGPTRPRRGPRMSLPPHVHNLGG